jgi:hypothetical protein
MVLREILRPKWDSVIEEWRRLCKEELYIYTPHLILLGLSDQEEGEGRDM